MEATRVTGRRSDSEDLESPANVLDTVGSHSNQEITSANHSHLRLLLESAMVDFSEDFGHAELVSGKTLRVATVSLPMALQKRSDAARIGNVNVVSQLGELGENPGGLRTGFHHDTERGARRKELSEVIARRPKPLAAEDLALSVERAEVGGAISEIESNNCGRREVILGHGSVSLALEAVFGLQTRSGYCVGTGPLIPSQHHQLME